MTSTEQLVERLKAQVMVLDGGLGTQLIAMGLERGQAPEWWDLTHPEDVADVHRRYIEAGSDIIQTNTFGASPPKLEASGLSGRCQEINTLAAKIARSVARPQTLVAGNVGPTGLLFPPMGDATEDRLRVAFLEQVTGLAKAGVDLISIETMYDLREALVAVQAARTTGLPVFASMTFSAKARGFFTLVGNRIGPSLRALGDAGAAVVGLNCSVDAKQMLPMVQEAKESVALPLVVQPNAGQPIATPQGVVYAAESDSFASDVVRLVEAGARVVGGCCGTAPDHIRAVRGALLASQSRQQ